MRHDDRQQKLVTLGADTLADTVLHLAVVYPDIYETIDHLLAPPKENMKVFKRRLKGLKSRKKFISYGGSGEFSRQLGSLLFEIRMTITNSSLGLELVSLFYQCDKACFERCDDSGGWVGDRFRLDAEELFYEYASRHDDKDGLISCLVELCKQDEYGVRMSLIEASHRFLTPDKLAELATKFESVAASAKTDYDRQHCRSCVSVLAKHLKNPEWFKQSCLAKHDTLTIHDIIDLANIYLDSGQAEQALACITESEMNGAWAPEKERLLLRIYKALNNKENMADILWRMFRRYPDRETLSKLIAVVGEEQREEIIRQTCSEMMSQLAFSSSNVVFLLDMGLKEEAERYIISRKHLIDGDHYVAVLPLAKRLEEDACYVPAVVLYRALLESILGRALSKYYHHGVRYLKKLDSVAPHINDWGGLDDHNLYFKHIRDTHARKSSFWAKYNG